MTRDMNLIRELLLYLEAFDMGGKPAEILSHQKTEGLSELCSPDELEYHYNQLISAGYIDGKLVGYGGLLFRSLTWDGHEFLDAVRDKEIWELTKNAADKVGGAGVEIIFDIAKGFAKTQLKKHTGIEF